MHWLSTLKSVSFATERSISRDKCSEHVERRMQVWNEWCAILMGDAQLSRPGGARLQVARQQLYVEPEAATMVRISVLLSLRHQRWRSGLSLELTLATLADSKFRDACC